MSSHINSSVNSPRVEYSRNVPVTTSSTPNSARKRTKSTANGLTQFYRVSETIGLNKWTLRFNDPEMEKGFLENCINRSVYTGVLYKIYVGICFSSMVAQTGVHFLAFNWYQSLSQKEIDWAIYVSMIFQAGFMIFLTVPLFVPKKWKNDLRFTWFYFGTQYLSQLCHKFAWEMLMIKKVPAIAISYPMSVIISINMQTFLCTIEGDFLSVLSVAAIIFLGHVISMVTLLLTYSHEEINILISNVYGTSWYTVAVDLPILFASVCSCIVIGYWFNLFARLRFFMHFHVGANRSVSTKERTENSTMTSSKLNPSKTEDSVQAQTQGSSKRSLLLWLWHEYLDSQKNMAFLEYSTKSLVFLTKQAVFPIGVSYCLNVVPIDFLSSAEKVIIVVAYIAVLALVVTFQQWASETKRFSTAWRTFLINGSIIFIALIFHVTFLVLPNGGTLDIFNNIVKTSIMLSCTLSSLAGLQTRASLLYIATLGCIMVIRLILQPYSRDTNLTWCYFILFAAANQFSIFVTLCLEMQLYQFFKSSPSFKTTYATAALA